MNINAKYFVDKFDMQKHPEGGYFSEYYRSEELMSKDSLPDRYDRDHCFSTSIYFLLEGDDFSAFHKVNSDELWHFYAGSSLTLYVLREDGLLEKKLIGNDPIDGESFYAMIKKNQWFAARTNDEDSYTLVGCTVAPGFEFVDFQLADREELIKIFPQYSDIIKQLTR